jgi:methanogenic corrinoid protein MtbC1
VASISQFEGHASAGDGYVAERGFGTGQSGLAAFRLHVDENYARSLTTLIESEIIPRLMVAHAADAPAPATIGHDSAIGAVEVEIFAPLVLQVEADALLAHVEAILARGVTFETVLVDLLAPTARLLGTFWENDNCDFVDVTMGLWRLQEVVHEISGRLPIEQPLVPGGRSALFSPMPGDQHSFGTVMIDDIFRREGWLTDRLSEPELADLLQRAKEDWFDIIGLTVTSDCHIGPLPSVIAALRKSSRNPRVCIMVGGRVLNADPDLAVRVGADGTARDAKCAPGIADGLVRDREWGAAAYS